MASTSQQSNARHGAQSHPYTCNTCQVAYRNIDLQKGHMKSDWHRYNLKRRVASLPPISADLFTEKVLNARAASNAEADKAMFERTCTICDKVYYSENAYRNHISSQKHRSSEYSTTSATEDDSASLVSSTFSLGEPLNHNATSDIDNDLDADLELGNGAQTPTSNFVPQPQPSVASTTQELSTEDGETKALPSLESCIFCNILSGTTTENVEHMERVHGMYIPEKAYLVDLDGLLRQLQSTVFEHLECIHCAKTSTTPFGAQTHMRDKGHCKIPFFSEQEQLEIGDHYDFTGTYSDSETDGEEQEQDQKRTVGKSKRSRRVHSGDEEDGWETDSSTSSVCDDDGDKEATKEHRIAKASAMAYHDDFELHLPTGRSVGHRSFSKFYRQNLHHYPTLQEQQERKMLQMEEEDSAETNENDKPRGMARRDVLGMTGVGTHERSIARKEEERGRSYQQEAIKHKDYAYGKKLNNQKTYYYRYQRGG